MKPLLQRCLLVFTLNLAAFGAAVAAPVAYDIDPNHSYPSFEADHMGISVFRGKFNKTTGKVVLDKEAGSGTVEVNVDLASIDFGHNQLNKWAIGPKFFNTAKFKQARYQAKLTDFVGGAPTQAVGQLTLHGVTRPLTLKINSFKCVPHPMLKRELCGADALGTFRRDEFGLDAGKEYGFNMDVTLRIQVEAVRSQ